MKKIYIFSLALTIVASATLSTKQIEEMVIKIHQKRPGIDKTKLDMTKDPFNGSVSDEDSKTKTVVKKDVVSDNIVLQLHAILGDKAFINNRWVKVNDKINGYELKYIGKRGVVLQNGNHIKKLLFKKDNLIKIEGR